MIKSVSITNHLGETIKLELTSPEKSGLAISNVTGIGPGKATINTTELATNDGTLFNSARINERNIVFTLLHIDYPLIEDSRHIVYKYFPLKKKITITFETDRRNISIDGYVESVEPNIFSKKEQTQVSVVCPSPYFYEKNDQITNFSSTYPLFEFPFSNEVTGYRRYPSLDEYPSDDEYPADIYWGKFIEFGEISKNPLTEIINKGEYEVGVTLRFWARGTIRNLKIFNLDTREMMGINTDILTTLLGSPIIKGDYIEIGTVKGNKYIYLMRDGYKYNILNAVSKTSDWFQLKCGSNTFTYTFDGELFDVKFELTNRTLYEGV